jgi:hypothetical protein
MTPANPRLVLLCALVCIGACSLGTAVARAQSPVCLSAHESAQRLRRDGRFLEARQQLLQCAQANCPRVVRNDCTSWASEVETSTPSLVFAVASSLGGDLAEVRVSANGVPLLSRLDGRAIAVDPGVYTLRFEADGHQPLEETITVRESEHSRFVRVELAALPAAAVAAPARLAPSSPANRRVWPTSSIVLGSLTLAAAGTALGFGVWGKREYNRVDDRCGPQPCADSEVDAGKRAYVLADVFAGVALVGTVASVWTYVRANRADAARTAPRVDAQLERGGLRLSFSRAF